MSIANLYLLRKRRNLNQKNYRERHPEKVAAYLRKRYLKTRTLQIAKSIEWQKENAERHKNNCIAYRKNNPEKRLKWQKEWVKNNPEKVKEIKRVAKYKRRAGLKANAIPFSASQWAEKVKSYSGMCAYCDTGKYEHQDHVVPVSRGGPHSLNNLVPACKSCNYKKGVQIWTPRPPISIA